MRSANVPVSGPTHSTFIFEVADVSIHGASDRTSVSWMSWNTGRISCGNGISLSFSSAGQLLFSRLHSMGHDHRRGDGSGQEGNQLLGRGLNLSRRNDRDPRRKDDAALKLERQWHEVDACDAADLVRELHRHLRLAAGDHLRIENVLRKSEPRLECVGDTEALEHAGEMDPA